MLGDSDSVKRDVANLLKGPKFIAALAASVTSNQDGFLPPIPSAIYQEERLSKLVFPMAELIVFRENYPETDYTTVKAADIELGIRWTAVAKDEKTVTRYVEVLASVTVDVLWDTILPRVQSGPVKVKEVDFSPMVPTAEHPYVKSALVLVSVQTWRA